MTPNPNPNSEGDIHETIRLVEYDMVHRAMLGSDGFTGERKEVAAIITALRAALTPPVSHEQDVSLKVALPAPGKVEFVAGPIWAETEDDCFTAEIQTVGGHNVVATVHGGTRDEAEQRQSAVLLSLSPTPATVAAANDEGVARIIDPAVWDEAEQYRVRADEWFAKGRTEPGDCLTDGYREKADAMQAPLLAKAVAIRLLSQGGGK